MNRDIYSLAHLPQDQREKQWEEEYRQIEAARELRRAKARSVLRMIRRVFRVHEGWNKKSAEASASQTMGPFFLPIDCIVGIITHEGRRRLPFLLSGRGVAGQWHRAFNRDDGAYPALEVIEKRDGWYLVRGTASVVQLEVLRAKRHRVVRVARTAPEDGPQCSACEGVLESPAMV